MAKMCGCASGYVPVVALHIMSITVVFTPPILWLFFFLLFTWRFNCCSERGWSRVEVSPPQEGDGHRATPQHFSKSPMSDYLRAAVIIQHDLNLPSVLWFDGFAHSLSVRLSHVKQADNLRAICCVCRLKHARRACVISGCRVISHCADEQKTKQCHKDLGHMMMMVVPAPSAY